MPNVTQIYTSLIPKVLDEERSLKLLLKTDAIYQMKISFGHMVLRTKNSPYVFSNLSNLIRDLDQTKLIDRVNDDDCSQFFQFGRLAFPRSSHS